MRHQKNILFRVLLTLTMTCSALTNSQAAGGGNIGNEVPSARAAGQGYVGLAAQNNDPTTVFINPAGMTRLKGTQVTAGLHWENIQGSYENFAGQQTKARVVNAAIPNFSVSQNLLDGKMGVGLSVQSPFGLETHWPGNSSLRYVATDSRMSMVQIMPAVAYQVHPKISLGAGAKYVNLLNAQLDRHLNMDAFNASQFVFTTGSPDAVSSLQGKAADWGYYMGLLFEPHEKHAFGLAYQSQVNLRVKGNVQLRDLSGVAATVFGGTDYNTAAYTDLFLPESIQFGYAFKPTSSWMLEADAAWYHWSEGGDVRIRYAETDPSRLQSLNTGNPVVFDNRDAWSLTTGANYKVNEQWQVRGGVWVVQYALPEQNFTPALADLNRTGLSTGAGYSWSKNWTVDVAYSAVFMHERSITNSVGTTMSGIPSGGIPGLGVPDPDISGRYKSFANLVALNLTYRF